MTDSRRRVALVVNKWWELDPVLGAALRGEARSPRLGWPDVLEHPRTRPGDRTLPPGEAHVRPRSVWMLRNTIVEAWCVSDLLELWPDSSSYQSSSQRKIELLPRLFGGRAPALVVAAGTAAWPDPDADPSRNGCVVAGRRCFLHDAHPSGSNPASRWHDGPFHALIDSSLGADAFARITALDQGELAKRFLRTPLAPGTPAFLAAASAVSLGTVNVTDYREYERADRETLGAWKATGDKSPAVSLETTHGLIRMAAGKAPFLFVSGIANRALHFADEVAPAEYAQNLAAAHNLGVVLGWMLPAIDDALA